MPGKKETIMKEYSLDDFEACITHGSNTDVLVRKASYLDNDCYHENDCIREKARINNARFFEAFRGTNCEIECVSDNAKTDISRYNYWIIVCENGTIFILQDLIGW